MISVNKYFPEIIFETLIDQLFNVFEKDISHENLKDFFDRIEFALKKINIDVEFEEDIKTKAIYGQAKIKDGQKVILIYLPIDFELTDRNHFIIADTILHEISHFINYNKIPDFIIQRHRNRLPDNIKDLADSNHKLSVYSMNNPEDDDVTLFLEYVFSPKEKSNQALSIVLSVHYDYKKHSVYELYKLNNNVLQQFHNEKNMSMKQLNMYLENMIGDSFRLFEIQFGVIWLRNKKYEAQLKSFLRLLIRYEKRLEGILRHVSK